MQRLYDSDAKTAEDICREYGEGDIVSVLTKSLQVFMPEMGVWQAIQTFDNTSRRHRIPLEQWYATT